MKISVSFQKANPQSQLNDFESMEYIKSVILCQLTWLLNYVQAMAFW